MNNPRFLRSTSLLTYSTVYVSIPWSERAPTEMVQYLYHELFIDLQKSLIGVCTVSKQKNMDNSISFVVEGILSVSYILKTVRKSYRYIYEIEIPLCLYSLKNEIYKKCSSIVNKHRSMIYVQITNKVVLFVGGRFEDVVCCRLEIYQIIEEFMGYRTRILRRRFNLPVLIKQGYKIFLGSFINSDLILLSQKDTSSKQNKEQTTILHNGVLKKPLKAEEDYISDSSHINDRTECFEMVYLDSMKYTYLLLYKKYEIDDILARNSTYISELETVNKTIKLMFISFSKKSLNLALVWFNKTYNSVIITNFSKPIYQKIDSLIIFEHGRDMYSTVIGDITKIKEIITDGKGDFEAFMDVEGETLDFLCGKKNGKIIKIMKGLGCIIEVTKRNNFDRSCVYIKGKLSVFKVALTMVLNEFPEHLTFTIDERHHKRIIGYGGKNIQKIMKKHGVYIKFMSHSEMVQEGYEHNVVIKTPRKNASNLVKMKDELFEAIEEPPCPKNTWKEVGVDKFYSSQVGDFKILFDRFLTRIDIPKVYFYDTKTLPTGLTGTTITLSNNQTFVCSTIKVDDKYLTVSNWLIKLPENERLLYIFNINGIRTFDAFYEDRGELVVVDCRFLI